MTKEQLVKVVRDYAVAHYNEDGWDFLVETWEDSDILETIGDADTDVEAVSRCFHIVSILDENRQEIMSTVW